MENIINKDTASQFAYTNEDIIEGEIKGVMVFMHGLNATTWFKDPDEPLFFYAKLNILYIRPYYDPWGWMNDNDVSYCDQVLDAYFDKYNLSKDIRKALI